MKKPRKSYMSYYKCDACGYPVSLPAKWAEIGHPRCLNPNCARKTQPLTLQKPRLKFPEDDLPGTDEDSIPRFSVVEHMKQVERGYKANRLRILVELNGHTPEEAQLIFEQEQQEENEP